jgi:hypothetical protein
MTLARNASIGSLVLLLISAACASVPEANVPEPVAQGAVAQEAPTQEAATPDVKPGGITHSAEGKGECLVCHAPGATPITDVTATHEGRGNETCMWCHATDSPMLTMTPLVTPHARATDETDCMRCHAPEANERATNVPATHEGRANGTCMWCHKKVEGV